MKKRVLCFLMAMLVLLSVPVETNAGFLSNLFGNGDPLGATDPAAGVYGAFKNVKHVVALDEGHGELCKRNITGEVTFDWPEPSTYIDLVIIQDFSGSFAGTIQEVGATVNSMIDSLNMGTESNGYPKDRAMVVTYRDGELEGAFETDGFFQPVPFNGGGDPAYEIANTGLMTDKVNLKNWVTEKYISYNCIGGTPTVDGMAEAQRTYKDYTPSSKPYNNSTYRNGSLERNRKTVYLLITDGAANTAKWGNLSLKARRELLGPDAGDSLYYGYTNYTDRSLLWRYAYRKYQGDFFGWGRFAQSEAYKQMLTAMKDLAGGIRESGGVNNSEATLVTAFWEDLNLLDYNTGTNGTGFSNWSAMSEEIKKAMLEMNGNHPELFATSNTNIRDFSEKLVKSFKKVATPIFDQVQITAVPGLSGRDYTLMKKNPWNEGYSEIQPGPESTIKDDNAIIVDMTSLETGSYKIVYKLQENEFKAEGYTPSNIKMIFEGKEQDIPEDAEDSNRGFIPKNTRTDCEISLNKKVSLVDKMPTEGTAYQELEKQRQYFYFNTNYIFTKKVQDALGSMVIRDVIDHRLEILDAWIVANNDRAKADALSGATPKGTLIAKLGDDLSVHRRITQQGQTLTYDLPKKEKTLGGVSFPFGDYDGKEYTLAVKVRLKDTVTDEEIVEMQETDPLDNRKKGIPNQADLLIDGKPKTSNKVKAVPPVPVPPAIKKFVKTDKTPVWSSNIGEMSDSKNSGEDILFSLDVPLPQDTSGYRSLVVEDQLDPALTFGGENGDIVVEYGEVDVNQELIGPISVSPREYVATTENGKLVVTITGGSLLKKLGGKTLSVGFKGKVKEDVDLRGYFNPGLKRFEIPNEAKVKANDFSYSPSNEVRVVWSPEKVTLKKKGEGVTPETFLSGAQFSVTEEGEESTGSVLMVTTGSDGTVEIGDLAPGKTYVVKETKAPSGYIKKTGEYWKIMVSHLGKISIVKYTEGNQEGEAIEGSVLVVGNVKPEIPTIEKFLKGEGEGKVFHQPSEEAPYKMSGVDELLTYEVKVPISSVAGYEKLEIKDTVDPNFVPEGNSLKAYTSDGSGGEVELRGIFKTTGSEFVWTKTSNFQEIKDFVVIRFQGRIRPNAWDSLFAQGNDGKVRNRATVILNNGSEVSSNTVVSQVTCGRVSITKRIQSGENYVLLPEGLSATFALYKKVGQQDTVNPDGTLTPGPGDKGDRFITDVTVEGGTNPVALTENLDPGEYYYVETTAPGGYRKASGKLPVEGYLRIPGNGGLGEIQSVTVDNEKAQDPTIIKQVKGKNRKAYSQGDYGIEIQEVWQYAIDVFIPNGTDESGDYIVKDEVNKKVLKVLTDEQRKPVVKSNRNDTGVMLPDAEATSWLVEPSGWNLSANDIKMVIPKEKVREYKGKTLRIEFHVQVLEGKNLLKEGVLVNGKLPNTSILYKKLEEEKEIGRSTVNVLPKLLRDIVFDKTLGGNSLSGADFALYPYEEGKTLAQMKEKGMGKDPFTQEPFKTTSLFNGRVTFKNVPVGEYALVEEKAPKGTLLPYEYVHLLVNPDATIAESSEDAVVFQTPDGRKLTGEPRKALWNNELVTFPVEKKWIGDDGLGVRPEKITVVLYRRGADAGEPERLGEVQLPHEGKWSYTFESNKDSLSNKLLYKYGIRTNGEYEYYVEEEGVPESYTSEKSEDGHKLLNTLKSHTLRLVKKDGDEDTPIEGPTFLLTDPEGTLQEARADNLGIVKFTDVKEGVRYTITEKPTEISEDYIVNTGTAIVVLGKDGKPTFIPDMFPLVDPDNNPVTDNSGYLFLNFKKPKPEKKVNGLKTYPLGSYTEAVTYTIEVPVKGVGDISEIKVTDKVDPAMGILLNSWDVYEKGREDRSFKDSFQIQLGEKNQTISFTASGQSVQGLSNKTLVFQFKAQLAVGPETLAKLHPDGVIPNEGILTLNNLPENEMKTNTVTVQVPFYKVTLNKTLKQTMDSPSVPAHAYARAEFDLVLQRGQWDDEVNLPPEDPKDLVLGHYVTDDHGKITLDNLTKGTYRFVETKAPKGYVPASPVEFVLDGAEGQSDLQLNVENNYMELPGLHKMVKGTDPATELKEAHLLSNWEEEFIYTVDMPIPEEADYTSTEFLDELPPGIVVEKDEDVSAQLGTGVGNEFVRATDLPESLLNALKVITPKLVRDEHGHVTHPRTLYAGSKAIQATTGGSDITGLFFKASKGKTLRFIYKGHLDPAFTDIGQFATDEEGYIVNRAQLTIDDTFTQQDTAKVKPTDQYGIVLQKIADFEKEPGVVQPLAGAEFELMQYELDLNGEITKGPELPPGIQTRYISDDNGYIKIPPRLIPGLYRLKEKRPPYEYVDKDGNTQKATFTTVYEGYILQVGANYKDGNETKKGVRLIGEKPGNSNTGEGATSTSLYVGPGTKEKPAQIVNRQQIAIPVKKVWDDDNNSQNTQPKEIGLKLQRAIVNGKPDKIQPDGTLKPDNGDEADTPDTEFNTRAESNLLLDITWPVGNAPVIFRSPELYRYTFPEGGGFADRKEYNYYVVEDSVPGYRATFEEIDTSEILGPSYEKNVSSIGIRITNALNNKAHLILKKVDDTTSGAQPVKGAVFNLTYQTMENGELSNVVKTLETGSDGIVDFGILASGRVYTFREIEAPAGYLKDDNLYTIVVDEEGNVKAYTAYDPMNNSSNIEVPAENFVHKDAYTVTYDDGWVDEFPETWTLTVVDRKLTTPKPEKKVNGKEDYPLKRLKDPLTYTVEVPVGSVEGMTKFELEDNLHNLLQFVSTKGDVKVEADGVDVKASGEVKMEDQKIIFTMERDFDKIANRTVKMTFVAKVKDSYKTVGELKEAMNRAGDNNAAITYLPNKATVKFNDNPNTSNETRVTPGDPGKKPTPDKKVNGVDRYELKQADEILHYNVKAEVGDNVLGYQTLDIVDTYDKALQVEGGVTLRLVTYEGDQEKTSETLTLGRDYTLTHEASADDEDGTITAAFGRDFDYTRVAGKTIVMAFDAKVKEGFDLSGYTNGEVPNKMQIIFNHTPGEEKTVKVVPPQKPTLDKKVNGKDEITVTDLATPLTYTMKATVPFNTEGIRNFTVADTFSKALKVTSAAADKMDGITVTNENNVVTMKIADDKLKDYAGQTITLTVGASMDTDGDEWKNHLVAGAIPNRAKLTIPGKPDITSDAEVNVPLGEVTLIKTADGNPLVAGTAATFELYQVVGEMGDDQGDKLIGLYSTVKKDGGDKIEVKGLPGGHYYFKEIEAPQGTVLDATPREFKVEITEDGVVTVTPFRNFNEFKVNNVTSDNPKPNKKVKEGLGDWKSDHLDLSPGDKTFTYKVEVPVTKVDGWTGFTLTDQVDSHLTVDRASVKVTIEGMEGSPFALDTVASEDGTFNLTDNLITFEFTQMDKVQALVGKTIILTFDAKITDQEGYLTAHPDAIVGNTAKVDVGHGPEDSNTVTVTPKFGEVTLTKQSDGKALGSNLCATFELYKEKTGGDVKVGTYRTDEKGKITVKNLAVGKYYFVETVAPAGHILDADIKRAFEVKADGTVIPGENFANFTVNNVTPKDGPIIDKKIVHGEQRVEHRDLSRLDEVVTYEIKVAIPDKVDGYKKLIITDHPDEKLAVERITVKIDDTDITNNADYGSLNGNIYTFKEGFDYGTVKGKTVIMTVKAKLNRAGVKVPNKAGLTFNANPEIYTEPVTVTPPGETPTPHKDVDGQSELAIGNLDQTFVFNVNYEVPTNVTGYTALELTDTIPKILEIVSKEVQVAGVRKSNLEKAPYLSVDGDQKVTLKLADDYDFTAIAGKKVNLAIRAKIKEGATVEELKPFLTEGIKNQAHLSFNGGEGQPTEEVKVIPPGDGPTVKKEVLNTVGSNPDRTKLALTAKDEVYKYHVTTTVPTNVVGYKSIVLEDTLEDVLQVAAKEDVNIILSQGDRILDDQEMVNKLKEGIEVNGQKVTLTVKKTFFGRNRKIFDDLAGKTLTLVIPASIKEEAKLDKYVKSEVPNTATLTFKGVTKTSNEVIVIPPGTTPDPQKDVNGKVAETIADKGTSFTYNLSYTVPDNVNGIGSIELYDKLEKVLETKDDKSGITVKVDDTTKDPWKDKVSIAPITEDAVDKEKTKVTLKLTNDDLTGLEGKTVKMAITANIKENADLTDYTDNTVPNKAEITINNGEGYKETPNVPVTLKGTVDIPVTKVWTEGSKELDYVKVYVVTDESHDETKAVKTARIFKEDSWTTTFKGLDKYDAAGREINYFVKEVVPEGYSAEVAKDNNGNWTITNTEGPSGEPGLEKKVNDLKSTSLGSVNDSFKYTIDITVPANTKDMTKLVLEDNFPMILQLTENATVAVKGTDDDANLTNIAREALVTSGQGVKLTIVGEKEVKKFAGARITITVANVMIDTTKALSSFLVDGVLPNTAILRFCDDPFRDKDSTAKVIPPVDPLKGAALLTKTLAGENMPKGVTATFELHRKEEDGTFTKVGDAHTTDAFGQIRVKDLEPGTYKWVETQAPTGFEKTDSNEFVVTGGNTVKVAEVTVDNKEKTTSVTVQKVWNGGTEDSHIPVKVQLTGKAQGGNREFVGDPVTLGPDNWSHTWTDLPTHTRKGATYTYGVEEVTSLENYTSTVTGDAEKGFTITNTFEETGELVVVKTWVDGKGDGRPKHLTFTAVQLLDGKETGVVFTKTFPVTGDREEYVIDGLPKSDGEKKSFSYELREEEVQGYHSFVKIEDGKFLVENRREERISIPFQKVWMGGEHHPSVTLTLYGDGEVVTDERGRPLQGVIPAGAAGEGLKGRFDDLPAFRDGVKIHYTLVEDPVEGYESFVFGEAAGGFTVVNTAKELPGLLLIKVDKATKALLPGAEFALYPLEEGKKQEEKSGVMTNIFSMTEEVSDSGEEEKKEELEFLKKEKRKRALALEWNGYLVEELKKALEEKEGNPPPEEPKDLFKEEEQVEGAPSLFDETTEEETLSSTGETTPEVPKGTLEGGQSSEDSQGLEEIPTVGEEVSPEGKETTLPEGEKEGALLIADLEGQRDELLEEILEDLNEKGLAPENLEEVRGQEGILPLLFHLDGLEVLREELQEKKNRYAGLVLSIEVLLRSGEEEMLKASLQEGEELLLRQREELEKLQVRYGELAGAEGLAMISAKRSDPSYMMKVLTETPLQKDMEEKLKTSGEGGEKEPVFGEIPKSQGGKSEEVPVAKGITDGNGMIQFKDLLPGKYRLKEVKAPEGYLLPKETAQWEVEVKEGETLKFIVENVKEKGPEKPEPEEPKAEDPPKPQEPSKPHCPEPCKPWCPNPCPPVCPKPGEPEPSTPVIPTSLPAPKEPTEKKEPKEPVKPIEDLPIPAEKEPVAEEREKSTPKSPVVKAQRRTSSGGRSPQTYDPGLTGTLGMGSIALLLLAFLEWKKRRGK